MNKAGVLLFATLVAIGTAFPVSVEFTAPTPDDGNTTYSTTININSSIINAPNMSGLDFAWGGNDYSIYGDRLLLAFNFDNRSALGENLTYAADVSPYNHTNMLGNTTTSSTRPSWNSSGKYGWALRFDGSNDFLTLGEPPSLDLRPSQQEFTLSAWIKTTATGTQTIIGKGSSSARQFSIAVAAGNFTTYMGSTTAVNSYYPVNDGEWHHVAAVVYNDSGTMRQMLYVDGEARGGARAVSSGTASGFDVMVGARRNSNNADTGDRFNGLIDEVRVWNRSLNASEMREEYFSNLAKINSTSWVLQTTQGKMPPGTYGYEVCASDSGGAPACSGSRSLTRNGMPLVSIRGPLQGSSHSSEVELLATISNDGTAPASVKYSLNGNPNVTMTGDATGDSWITYKNTEDRLGVTDSYAPKRSEAVIKWRYRFASSSGDEYQTVSILNGIGYFQGKSTAVLLALNLTTGAQMWNLTDVGYSDGTLVHDQDSPGSVAYIATCTGTGCVSGSGRGAVYALDISDTGQQTLAQRRIWQFNTSTTSRNFISTPGIDYDHGIMFACEMGNSYSNPTSQPICYGINKTTGAQIWSWTYGARAIAYMAPTYWDGMVYVGFYNSSDSAGYPRFFALNATSGAQIWNASVHGLGIWDSSAVVKDGFVYVGNYNGTVYKWNATSGAQIWNKTINDDYRRVIYPTLSIDGDRLYGATSGSRVFCLNTSDGAQCSGWSDYVHSVAHWASPAVADGLVIAATREANSRVFALNKTSGALAWMISVDDLISNDYIYSSPSLANGMVYITADNGNIYAIGEEEKYTYKKSISSGLVDGANTLTVYAENADGTVASSTVTFDYDGDDGFSINFTNPTEDNGATVARPYILANASASWSGIENITIYLYAQDGALVNRSFTDSAQFLFVNITGLHTGKYYLNATAYGAGGQSNRTETRNITVNINSGTGECYENLDGDTQALANAETAYFIDEGDIYTCNMTALGWAPTHTSADEWVCEYASTGGYRWTYTRGASNANVTDGGIEISAVECTHGQMSPGCTEFSAQVRNMQTAEEAYYTDYGTYSCDIAAYWVDPIPDGWVCDSATGSGYDWTFTSQLGEEFLVDETTGIDCSGDLYCNATGFDGDTTNVSAIIRTHSFSGLTVELVGAGMIHWPGPINVSGFDLADYVVISDNFVSVDSAAMPNLDLPANVSIYGLGYVARPVIYRNGALCGGACPFISYSGGTYKFQVAGFSNYTAGPNAALGIFDDNDAEGGSKGKEAGDNVYFFANYTNITSGAAITGATCSITFSEAPVGPASMGYNSTSGLYEYNRTFSSPILYWNVSCSASGYEPLNLSDTFTSFNASLVELYAANVTVGSTGRYSYTGGAGNLTTEGGNVTNVNLTSNASTDRWAGFYGNITGSIVLAQANDLQMVYVWPWDSADGGTVCASTASSAGGVNISGAQATDIDSAWSFSPSATDSAANTFTGSGCGLRFGPTMVSGANYADTGTAGGFITCAYKTASGPTKSQMFFCANITENGQLFNGGAGDFELMAPTAYGSGVYETYYFYLNLN